MVYFLFIWLGSIVGSIIIADNKRLFIFPFILLSLFLGPIGLLITALVPANKPQDDFKVNSFDDLKCEFARIKDEFSRLQFRLSDLERRVNCNREQPVGSNTNGKIELPVVEAAGVGLPETTAAKNESFEFVLGKYWLNRIGVVLFVIGVAFFISYTFKYLDAFARISVGYLFSLSFFIWGNILEKKEKYKRLSWGILGGAWGLLYLSTYAMHYIAVTRIISNPLVELWLLAGVSLLAISYNFKYRSWVVTAITYLLAFFTAGLGGVEYSVIFYCAFLTAGIVFLSSKLKWHEFLIFGICGTYLTYSHWFYPQMFSGPIVSLNYSVPVYQFNICFSILTISWILFSAALLLLKPDNRLRLTCLVSSALLNGGFYVFFSLYEIHRLKYYVNLTWDVRFWFLIIAAGLYCAISYIYKISGKKSLIVANMSIAWTLVAMAIMFRFSRMSVGFFWIIEMLILFAVGFYYKERIYRIMAAILSIFIIIRLFVVDFYADKYYSLLNLNIPHNVLVIGFAALCFFILGVVVRMPAIKKILVSAGERGLYNSYPAFGTFLIVSLLGKEITPKWLSLAWTIEAAAILVSGFLLRNRVYRICALTVLGLTCLRLISVDISGIDTIYRIVIYTFLGAVLIAVSFIYSRFKAKERL